MPPITWLRAVLGFFGHGFRYALDHRPGLHGRAVQSHLARVQSRQIHEIVNDL
jgi:hypothetical protein